MRALLSILLVMAICCLAGAGWLIRDDGQSEKSGPAAMLFEGLGKHSRSVSKVEEAQRYFDQGMAFLFAFNHDEALRSFAKSAELDPKCAMAQWGIAYANGPHINKPAVPPERAKAAWTAWSRANELSKSAAQADQALIAALRHRCSETPVEDRQPLEQAYAQAMRKVREEHPDDADLGALLAEALMNLRPWDLWKPNGEPQPETPEILEILENVMKQSPDHPLALHLYIHATEASLHPEKADEAADRLRHLCPGLGHLVHMPSHIDIRRGRWQEAIEANSRAIQVDQRYRQLRPTQGFYRLYMAHNHHMLAFAAMMQGESKRSLEAIRVMLAGVPLDWAKQKENALFMDAFFALPAEVLMRFGRWQEVLDEPLPPEHFPVARAMTHFARSAALANTGKAAEARAEQKLFLEWRGKAPKEASVGNNPAERIFSIAEKMLQGELLVKEGKLEEGIAALREAIKVEDELRYDEPPDWLIPVRHALGAFLLQAGQAAEAEAAYREDLRRWPENGWSLFGLAQSLEKQGREEEAKKVRDRFAAIWKHADVKLRASCFCQGE